MATNHTKEPATNTGSRNEHNEKSNNEADVTNGADNGENEPISIDKAHKYTPKNLKPTIIYNNSNFELSEPMNKVLNRGLNIAILPLKLDITQVLVDFKRFERSVIWQEFWYGKKIRKNNLKNQYLKQLEQTYLKVTQLKKKN